MAPGLYDEFIYELSEILKYGDKEIVTKIYNMAEQAIKFRGFE